MCGVDSCATTNALCPTVPTLRFDVAATNTLFLAYVDRRQCSTFQQCVATIGSPRACARSRADLMLWPSDFLPRLFFCLYSLRAADDQLPAPHERLHMRYTKASVLAFREVRCQRAVSRCCCA